MKKFKIWKLVKKDTYKDVNDCIKKLKKSGIILSPWIENIFKNKIILFIIIKIMSSTK